MKIQITKAGLTALSIKHDMTLDEIRFYRRKYNQHKCNVATKTPDRNGTIIEFNLTFCEWLLIWVASGHLKERGPKTGQYVMSRKNDLGHYAVGNVVIARSEDNHRECNSWNPMSPECHPNGGNCHQAVQVKVGSIIYETKDAAHKATGISLYLLGKYYRHI